MKRYGNLFSRITDSRNILQAHLNARRGKAHYKEVIMVNQDPEHYCGLIRDMLVSKTFSTSPYILKQIHEPKERTIYKLPYYPDRIVHHAIMQVLQPIWDRTFIHDLYSAIPGRGLHAGSYRLREFMKDRMNTQYCLKFDITKFYPSMRHDVLYSQIERQIKCPGTLDLLHEVIYSLPGGVNIPIGNYLSQYFGNIYLSGFDHWLKEDQGMRYYLRYCDDGVILHKDKSRLLGLQKDIVEYLSGIGLTLNRKTQIFPVDVRGIDFLGYRHFRDYTLLRKSSATKLKLRMEYLKKNREKLPDSFIKSSLASYAGWIKHCDCKHFAKSTGVSPSQNYQLF